MIACHGLNGSKSTLKLLGATQTTSRFTARVRVRLRDTSQSALSRSGSVLCNLLCLHPAPLFKRAILQSGAVSTMVRKGPPIGLDD